MEQGQIVTCKNCGNAAEDIGYQLPLCAQCRDALSKRPIPLWLKGMGIIVIIIFIMAIIRFPKTLSLGIWYEKGVKAEQSGNYAEAENYYRKALDNYPDSDKLTARFGVSAYKNNDLLSAVNAFNKLSGREIDKDLADEINPLLSDLSNKIKAADLKKK